MRMHRSLTALAASTALVGTMGLFAAPLAPVVAATCSPAGSTGLTAAMVVTSGQRVHGITVDASGCDVGIFVGPGTTGVMIDGVTVTGANDHGIFVQNAEHITIKDSTVMGNGVAPHQTIAENRAKSLAKKQA